MKKLLAILLTSFAASAGNASTTILCKYEDGSHLEDGVLLSYPTKGSFTLSFNEDFVVKTNRSCPKEIENFVTEDAIVLRCMRGEIEASLLICGPLGSSRMLVSGATSPLRLGVNLIYTGRF